MAQNSYLNPGKDLSRPYMDEYDDSSAFSADGRFGRINYLAYSFLTSLVFGLIVLLIFGGSLMTVGSLDQLEQDITSGNVDLSGFSSIGMIISFLLYIPMTYLSFVYMIRRLHDFNASGWFSLLIFVPLVNVVITLLLLFKPGTLGPNDYGYPPRPPKLWRKIPFKRHTSSVEVLP